MLRREDDAAALAPIDGFNRGSELGAGPIANFDEHEHIAIAHDEIDFSQRAAIVALDTAQTVGPQVRFRQTLRSRPCERRQDHGGGKREAASVGGGRGTGVPLTNWAKVVRRATLPWTMRNSPV